MIRTPARLFSYAAMLALAVPLAAQQQGGFILPQPTPSPTPAPAGPADERAGVAIPPRSAPAPQPEAAPVLTPEAGPRPAATASTQAADRARVSAPTAAANPVPVPRPGLAPTAAAPAAALGADAQSPAALPGDPVPQPAPLPLPESSALAPALAAPAASDEPALPALPTWWPWAAGVLGALAVLGAGLMLRRRRAPTALRLATQPPVTEHGAEPLSLPRPSAEAAPNTLDVTLEITAASRSVMMFTLHYRIVLANRSAQAVNGVSLAAALTCARHGADNAPLVGAAQRLQQIDRIGPHQTRTIAGEVQLPLSQIAPLRQGNLLLFVPLAHVTIEGDSQHACARSFVIGTPSAAGTGRLHPIRLDQPPGSIAGLQAQRIDMPAISAAA